MRWGLGREGWVTDGGSSFHQAGGLQLSCDIEQDEIWQAPEPAVGGTCAFLFVFN